MAKQSLLCNLRCAFFAKSPLNQPVPLSKSLEAIALSNRGYAVFAMQSLLRNRRRAYREPTFVNEKTTGIQRSEQSWVRSLCYAIFAMLHVVAEPTLS